MKPNVLVVVLDTVRAANCSVYGYDRQTTPRLSALRGESVRFEHTIAPATWTVPSHAAMFTGRYPSELGVHARNKILPATAETAADRLSHAGYETAIMSSNPFLTEGTGLHRGFDHRYTSGMRRALFEDAFDPARYIKTREHEQGIQKIAELAGELSSPLRDLPKNVLNALYYKYRTTWGTGDGSDSHDPTQDDGATETISEFKQWVPDDEPFFACLNFMEAHTPFRYRDRFLPEWASMEDVRALSQDRETYFRGEATLDDRQKELLQSLYDAEIRYLDEQLQSLWTYLRDNDMWEDTLLVVTSDHGENLGEDGYIFHHSNLLGEHLVHVPLLVKYPDNKHAGATVEETVSLTNLYDTVVNAGEESTGRLNPLEPGMVTDLVRSEFVCLDPQHSTEEYVEPYRRLDVPSRAVYEGGTKYVLFGDGRAYTFEGSDDYGSLLDIEPGPLEKVPAHVRSFANLDVDLDSGEGIEVSDSVESRLEELGYR
ncbi:sulfatase [Haloterrigena salina]|nr:sulfatase [Haloterrigena salina]